MSAYWVLCYHSIKSIHDVGYWKGVLLIKTQIDDILDMMLHHGGDIMSKNPYTPGAGTPPAFLAGRDKTLADAIKNIDNVFLGGTAFHTIYYGVRGVGKTVLLNKIEQIISDKDSILHAHIECVNGKPFSKDIAVAIKKFLLRMESFSTAKDMLKKAMGVFKAFTLTWNPGEQSLALGINGDTLLGSADTGSYSDDLTEVFLNVGRAAQEKRMALCLFIDEIQSLNKEELSALLTAIHRVNQHQLPLIVLAAGLPTILRLASEAKSYSERLFQFVPITSLDRQYAIEALEKPASPYQVTYEPEARDFIVSETSGYPYFIQEFGRHVWNYIEDNVIPLSSVQQAYPEYISALDNSFYSSRYNRVTHRERDFLYSMVQCSHFPCQMAEIAHFMGKPVQSISPLRGRLMNKGLIYAPSYGEVDFTVPKFDAFLFRKEKDAISFWFKKNKQEASSKIVR